MGETEQQLPQLQDPPSGPPARAFATWIVSYTPSIPLYICAFSLGLTDIFFSVPAHVLQSLDRLLGGKPIVVVDKRKGARGNYNHLGRVRLPLF